jgi:hypothetical protein
MSLKNYKFPSLGMMILKTSFAKIESAFIIKPTDAMVLKENS